MKFSEKLQTLRKDNKLSQEQLADMLDVSRQAVSKWESGQTYPEMDKLLAMTKIFGCSLDDLTNDDIKDIRGNTKNKSTAGNLVDEVLEIINRTCAIFKKLKPLDLVKIIFAMLIVVIVLLLCHIPVNYIYSLGVEVFMNFGFKIGDILSSIFKFILEVAYFILSLLIFVYIYKIRVLDHYEQINTTEDNYKEDKEVDNSKKNNHIEKETLPKREVIVKKEKSYTIFKLLGSMVMACIKFFVICLAIPFVISLLLQFAALIISILIIFKGVFFLGIIIGILSLILLNIIILNLIFNFLFNKTNSVKRLFIMFAVSIAALGIGVGITMWDFTNMNYINGVPEEIEKEKYEVTYPMKNDIIIDPYNSYINYAIDESLENSIRIEISSYENYSHYYVEYNDGKYIYFNQDTSMHSIKDFVDITLKYLSKKQLYLYEGLYDGDITVYTSSKNREVLLNNIKNYLSEKEQSYYSNQIKQYQEVISDYEKRLNELENNYYANINSLKQKKQYLEEKSEKLEEENENLRLQIEEYKNTIAEYRDALSNLLENS